jgi:hypothetical protein
MTDPIVTGAETDAKGLWAKYKVTIIASVVCLIVGLVLGKVL